MENKSQLCETKIEKGDLIEFAANNVRGYNAKTIIAPVEFRNADQSCWVVTIAGWVKLVVCDIISVNRK